jgi:hypothetical protein
VNDEIDVASQDVGDSGFEGVLDVERALISAGHGICFEERPVSEVRIGDVGDAEHFVQTLAFLIIS